MSVEDGASWRQMRDGKSITQRTAYCERLICVDDDVVERGWWHELERTEELLFAEGERIVETRLEDLNAKVEEAVDQGYRPVVLIDGMRNWAPATDALGRHGAFANVLVMGRDDRQITELLHNPSQEILACVHDGAWVAVPSLDYGKALDGYLNPRLEDFDLIELSVEDPLAPDLKLICRLNPFRYLDVKLYCRNGVTRLTQKYRVNHGLGKASEPCVRSLRFSEWLLDFAQSNPVNTSELAGGPAAFMEAFSEFFELPQAYRGWEPDREPPWKTLLQRLDQMSLGAMSHLGAAHQGLLALVSKEVIAEALESLRASASGLGPALAPVRGLTPDDREGSKKAGANRPFLILSGAPEQKTVALVFEVTWLFGDKPKTEPRVVLDRGSTVEARIPFTYEWSQDLMSLRISGIAIGEKKIGWVWVAEENVLTISLVSEVSA